MQRRKIQVVVIQPNGIPRPTWIDDDLRELSRSVNIDKYGRPHPEFAPFEISEIKDGINIISSPKGEERSLPLTRTIGRYLKFYGTIYLVKMDELDLISMTDSEAIDLCIKFMSDKLSMEILDLPPIDYGDDDDGIDVDAPCACGYKGRIEIEFDDW